MLKHIKNHCFEWKMNEVLWPSMLNDSSSMISKLSFIDYHLGSSRHQEQKSYPEVNEDYSSCHLRAGVFPDEIMVIGEKQFICSRMYDVFIMVLRNLKCRYIKNRNFLFNNFK